MLPPFQVSVTGPHVRVANRASAERKRLDEMAAANAGRAKALSEAQEALQREAEAEKARARRIIQWISITGALLVILAVSGFGFQQQRNAAKQRDLREAIEKLRRQTQITESGLLSNAANAEFGVGGAGNPILLALNGMPL